MRTLRMSLFVISALSAGEAQAARFWFSLSGVDEFQPIDGTPGEFTDFFTGVNPELLANIGLARLYVWGTRDPFAGGNYYDISWDITAYVTEGDVRFVDSRMYNYFTPDGRPRWDAMQQGTLLPNKLDDAIMVAGSGGYGFTYKPTDVQYDPQTDSMLLGFVELQMSPDARAEIFFGVGPSGMGEIPNQALLFGWGDDPVPEIDGRESTLADATIVPEPATLLLALAAAGAARVGRRRGK